MFEHQQLVTVAVDSRLGDRTIRIGPFFDLLDQPDRWNVPACAVCRLQARPIGAERLPTERELLGDMSVQSIFSTISTHAVLDLDSLWILNPKFILDSFWIHHLN